MIRTLMHPPAAFLFQSNNKDKQVLMSKMLADDFQYLMVKLLFLSKQAQPDIQMAVKFLCTQVKELETDDQGKMAKVLMIFTRDTRITGNPSCG